MLVLYCTSFAETIYITYSTQWHVFGQLICVPARIIWLAHSFSKACPWWRLYLKIRFSHFCPWQCIKSCIISLFDMRVYGLTCFNTCKSMLTHRCQMLLTILGSRKQGVKSTLLLPYCHNCTRHPHLAVKE